MQFFRQVEVSSDYLFNYKDQDVADIRVSVKVADASIQEVMDLALSALRWSKGRSRSAPEIRICG